MRAAFYKCAAAKQKKTCGKKSVRKQWLEDLVVSETMKLVEDDAMESWSCKPALRKKSWQSPRSRKSLSGGEATEAASEGNGSDLDCFTAPENAVKSKDFMAFLFCEP